MTIFSENDFNSLALAQDQFQQKRFKHCIETLNQLEKTIGKHLKIVHNKAVAEFFDNECKQVEALKIFLEQEERLRSNSCNHQMQQSSSIAIYNLGVIYFNEKQYTKAIEILFPLIENLDNIYESTAGKVGFLLLHLFLTTNQVKKADSFLNMLSKSLNISLDFTKDESFELSSASSAGRIKTNCDHELRNMIQLIKIRIMILNNETFNFPEEIPKGSLELKILEAFSSFKKNDLKSASQFLIASQNIQHEDYEFLDILLGNNMGLLNMMDSNFGIAENFLQCALKFDKLLHSKIKTMPVHFKGYLRTPEIVYNLGLSKLYLNKAKEAFDCLLLTLRIYKNNPRLWLRVAEACIMHYKSQEKENNREEEMKQSSINGHKFRVPKRKKKIFFNSNSAFERAIPAPTIEFASLCLSNCIKIIGDHQKQNIEIEEDEWKYIQYNICEPSSNISPDSLNKLLASAYLNSSFVALELGDYVNALRFSQNIFKIQNVPISYIYLGRLYAGKALIHMNDLTGGHKQFNLENDFSEKLSEFHTQRISGIPSGESARLIMKYNCLLAEHLQGKADSLSIALKLKSHPCISSKIK